MPHLKGHPSFTRRRNGHPTSWAQGFVVVLLRRSDSNESTAVSGPCLELSRSRWLRRDERKTAGLTEKLTQTDPMLPT